VINKTDLLPADVREKTIRAFVRKLGWKGKVFTVSALTGEGCQALTYAIMDHIEQEQRETSGAT
jgi:GTP-binding protein